MKYFFISFVTIIYLQAILIQGKLRDDVSLPLNFSVQKQTGSSNDVDQRKKLVIAHMTNTPGSVRWALDEGANGVEVDLRFNNDNNEPFIFQHSYGLEPCDCSCICLTSGNGCPKSSVCNALWTETGSHCKASSTAEALTLTLGEPDIVSRLALVYIDSKLDNKLKDYWQAGSNVVKLLNKNMFERGYKGQVIISASDVKYLDYLKGALEAAKDSEYASRYFYTFDSHGTDSETVWNSLLELGTRNLVYSTGITICMPNTYYDAIKNSLSKDVYAAIGIWTLDKRESMEAYKEVGVTAIMTNQPDTAVNVFGGSEYLAKPGEALIPKSSVPEPKPDAYWECDCNYHKGGCTISRSSPRNYACNCIYRTLMWTCTGKTVSCRDVNSEMCKNPKPFKNDCKFGDGDCGGYR